MRLFEKSCLACKGNLATLSPYQATQLLKELPKWQVKDNKFLLRQFRFEDFAQALRLANEIGRLAEVEGHHPDLLISWGLLEVTLWTHAVNGLTENDFILAAKIDRL